MLLVAIILTVGMVLGCESVTTAYPPTPDQPPNLDNSANDPPDATPPVSSAPSFFNFPVPVASGYRVEKNQNAEIDYSNAADGYIMVRFLASTDMQLRVRITGPSGIVYTYILNSKGDFEVFPLTDGNGSYNITVFEQVEGNKYATSLTHDISVTLTDPLAPFLRPNQYVNFTPNSTVVIKAAELVGGITDFFEKIGAIYHFVIENITYDTEFAEAVIAGNHSGYLPNVDDVLSRRKGICFDYAALMTAMLRSQGIPTKLVIGYTGDVYHAWINVFSEEIGWIDNIIQFDGHAWTLMDPTFASTGHQSADVMRYIGDVTNYNAMFAY